MSIAFWVELIALAGVAAETSAVMLSYLDEACRRRAQAGRLHSLQDLLEAVAEGAMERIRPGSMTALANIIGLLPVMWASGVGADVMKHLAAPMGGDRRRVFGDAADLNRDSRTLYIDQNAF